MSSERPLFLNFARLRFPVGAVASLGHRISGVLLFLALPFLVWALERSLRSERPFDLHTGPLARLAFVLLAWPAAHHLFAGIRHLLSDADIGSSLRASRASAWAALIGALAVGLAALVLPWDSFPGSGHSCYSGWARSCSSPAAVLLLLAGALFLHAWVGVRDVVLDYVHPLPLRTAVLLLVAGALLLLGGWTAVIVVTHAL